ncbi:vWA domain-containing protein [Opitutus sp. GAS368]|jgi:Mg-chelatase subunit ChlD|uniref:vWA domain-containing protein n=1 Tax=Opitutus sp. GAS368 TaxID=1882749 RepID=UPI000B880471|nr:vWA domain-containing protein [Opitutus sp. GAS368]
MRPKSFFFAALAAAGLALLSPLSAHDADARSPRPARPRMEVVFVLDTTGSMSGMIAGAKQKIWAIANKLKSAQPTPEIRFGLVGYRDRGDVYVTKVFGLTGNLDEVYTNLYAFEAEGGGDEPESVNEALHKAVRDLQWSTDPEVLRVIFLVGDARPHMDYPDDVKYPETCRLANRKGILINTLQCGRLSGTEEVWREIAALTNGTYSAILQDGGTIKIETPYDQEIIRLNLQLNATIIRYGSKDEQENAAKNKSVLAALSSEAMADRSSYLGKGEAGAVLSGRGDLVVEVMNGRESLDKLDEEKLAPELQAMAPGARQELIAKKVEERRTLQAELAELVAKRDAEVAKQMKNLEGKGGAMELDAFRALETQAREKGYRFEEKR